MYSYVKANSGFEVLHAALESEPGQRISRNPVIAWRIDDSGEVAAIAVCGAAENRNYNGRLAIRNPDGRCKPCGSKMSFKDEDAWHKHAVKLINEHARLTQKAIDESVDEDLDEVVD